MLNARCPLLLLTTTFLVAGCRGEPPTPIPAVPARPAATLAALPSAVPASTDTPIPGPGRPSAETLLPADPHTVVFQTARIRHSPWEPQILAQMVPGFSLQASGFGVFPYAGGPGVDGWYQTALSTGDALRFVRLMVDEIGVLELAEQRPTPDIVFSTNADGSAGATEAVIVVYVRTAEGSGRLFLEPQELDSPTGPGAERIDRLGRTLRALELWKSGVTFELTPEQVTSLSLTLGWTSNIREPYSPDEAVAFGTRARVNVPDSAPSVVWPLPVEAAASFDVPFGLAPRELVLRGDDAVSVIRADQQRQASFWGPLWSDPGRQQKTLVGIRPGTPGTNHVVVDYEYKIPPPAVGLQR